MSTKEQQDTAESVLSTVRCPYCGQQAQLVSGAVIYPHRHDLHKKSFYLCPPCEAYVGCHPGTVMPLGRLANAELRKAKMAAHEAFDPVWKTKRMKRGEAYAWLAKKLRVNKDGCHIGVFDVEMCRRVVVVCKDITGTECQGKEQ